MNNKSLVELVRGNTIVSNFVLSHISKTIQTLSINSKNIYSKEHINEEVKKEVTDLFEKCYRDNSNNFVELSSMEDEVSYRLSREVHIYNIYTDKLIGVILPLIGGEAERELMKDKFSSLETI